MDLVTADTEELIDSVAVAIAGFEVTRSAEQRHVGLLFHTEETGLRLIHLGWHNDFDCSVPTEPYYWLPIKNMHPVTRMNFADWLDVFWQTHGSEIPYSFIPFETSPFDATGNLRLLLPGEGFTCATFVLWAFHAMEIRLVDIDSWPERDDDQVWRGKIIGFLEHPKSKATPEHIAAMRDAIEKVIRIRPEEIAGAASDFAGETMAFETVNVLAAQIFQRMNADGAIADGRQGRVCVIT